MRPFAYLRDLRFTPPNAVVHVGGGLSVEVTLCSQMPVPVQLEQIVISVHFSVEKNNYRKTAEWLTKHKASSGVLTFPPEPAPFPAAPDSGPALELYEMFERSPSDNSLTTTGILCRNVHMLLRRQESGPALDVPSPVALEDGAHVLRCSGVTLQPGANTITFRTQVREGRGVDCRAGRAGRRPAGAAGSALRVRHGPRAFTLGCSSLNGTRRSA